MSEPLKEGAQKIKALSLKQKGKPDSKGNLICNEDSEITVKTKDVIWEIQSSTAAKNSKKKEPEYQVNTTELSKIERLVKNLIGKYFIFSLMSFWN